MIKQNDIVAAVKAALLEKFPGETVYENHTPSDFDRPAWLVENGKLSVSDVTVSTVSLLITVRIVAFAEVDEYHDSQLAELNDRQLAALGLFLPLYLRVKDRALDVQSLDGNTGGRDWSDVTVVLGWEEDRAEIEGIRLRPIEDVHLAMSEGVK